MANLTQHTLDQRASYYLTELEKLLRRVEVARTPHEALSLQPSAGPDEVKVAYQWATTMLSPPNPALNVALTAEVKWRIDSATRKLASAVTMVAGDSQGPGSTDQPRPVLRSIASGQRQGESEKLSAPPGKQNPEERQSATNQQNVAVRQGTRGQGDEHSIGFTQIPANQRIRSEQSSRTMDGNRRRSDRVKLAIPALVTGYDVSRTKWQEMTKTVDVSRLGAALTTKRKVKVGMILHLSLPLPLKLRNHGFSDSSYSLYGIIRRIEMTKDGAHLARLEFLGKEPPPSYLDRPWSVFRTRSWSGIQRRRNQRIERMEAVNVQYLDPAGELVRQDSALTENISRTGVRIRLKESPPDFEIVRLSNRQGTFTGLAAETDRFKGKDGFDRLCLRFLDKTWEIT